MLPHWDSVVQPLLDTLDAGPIIEIGAYSGETTALLAEHAEKRDTVLHVVDPDPRFDIADFERRYGDHFRLHMARSHDVLERLDPATVVIIDGDHNWYTVNGELERLARVASRHGREFPLVFFHDMEWPYARRDMYWEPDAIPEEWRNPWSHGGIKWGQTHLDDSGAGLNHGMAHALEEGGPRNGVLTAVEDFIERSSVPLDLQIVSGDHGLGILVSHSLLTTASPRVRSQWNRLRSPEFLIEHTRQLSRAAAVEKAARKRVEVEAQRLKRELAESSGVEELHQPQHGA